MKSKQFFSGLVVGAILATSMSVFASGVVIPAIQKSNLKLYIDGEEIPSINNGYVLNYGGYNYTSVRLVAEALGAEVSHQTNVYTGAERIDITPKPDPAPIIITAPEIKEEDDEEPVSTIKYYLPPAKDVALGNVMYIYDVVTVGDYTYLRFDFENRNYEDIVLLDYQNIKITTDTGKVYKPTNVHKDFFLNSLINDHEYEEQELIFPEIEPNTNFTLEVPLTRRQQTMLEKVESDVLEFNLIVEDLNLNK